MIWIHFAYIIRKKNKITKISYIPNACTRAVILCTRAVICSTNRSHFLQHKKLNNQRNTIHNIPKNFDWCHTFVLHNTICIIFCSQCSIMSEFDWCCAVSLEPLWPYCHSYCNAIVCLVIIIVNIIIIVHQYNHYLLQCNYNGDFAAVSLKIKIIQGWLIFDVNIAIAYEWCYCVIGYR